MRLLGRDASPTGRLGGLLPNASVAPSSGGQVGGSFLFLNFLSAEMDIFNSDQDGVRATEQLTRAGRGNLAGLRGSRWCFGMRWSPSPLRDGDHRTDPDTGGAQRWRR